jgi:hypothetical protein
MSVLNAGQKCFLVVAGSRQVVTVLKTVSDTDGFDGRGYVVGLAPGAALTVAECQLEPVSEFVAGLVGLMTDPNGKATLREAARKAPKATPADGIDAIEDRAHAKAMAAAARRPQRFDTGVEGVCRYCRLGNAVCTCP